MGVRIAFVGPRSALLVFGPSGVGCVYFNNLYLYSLIYKKIYIVIYVFYKLYEYKYKCLYAYNCIIYIPTSHSWKYHHICKHLGMENITSIVQHQTAIIPFALHIPTSFYLASRCQGKHIWDITSICALIFPSTNIVWNLEHTCLKIFSFKISRLPSIRIDVCCINHQFPEGYGMLCVSHLTAPMRSGDCAAKLLKEAVEMVTWWEPTTGVLPWVPQGK